MKFTLPVARFAEVLGFAGKSLPSRPSAPVLAGVKITATDDGVITVAGFDYEQSTVASAEAAVAAPGTIVVSGKLLADIARALPQGDVTLALDGNRVKVTAGRAAFQMATMPVEDYPTLPDAPATFGTVNAVEFTAAARQVIAAASKDEMLPVLTSLCVQVDPAERKVTLAATDRFRLAVRTLPYTPTPGVPETALTALVPSRVVDGWVRTLPNDPDLTVALGAGDASEGLFSMRSEGRVATVRLIGGQYPNFSALIPKDFGTKVTFNADALKESVRRVSLVAERATPIRLAFSDGNVEVSASADSDAAEDVAVDHDGDSVTIGFNGAYLTDGLNAMPEGSAVISLVASNKPAVIRPIDPDVDLVYLLMPMRAS